MSPVPQSSEVPGKNAGLFADDHNQKSIEMQMRIVMRWHALLGDMPS
jgi:hypothetical protein